MVKTVKIMTPAEDGDMLGPFRYLGLALGYFPPLVGLINSIFFSLAVELHQDEVSVEIKISPKFTTITQYNPPKNPPFAFYMKSTHSCDE